MPHNTPVSPFSPGPCVLTEWTLTRPSPDEHRGSSPQELPLGTHPNKSLGQPVAPEGRGVMEPHFVCTLSDSPFPEKCMWWTQPQGSWGPPIPPPLCSQASWIQEGCCLLTGHTGRTEWGSGKDGGLQREELSLHAPPDQAPTGGSALLPSPGGLRGPPFITSHLHAQPP